jgi:mono/diheme cytochrome c family protein
MSYQLPLSVRTFLAICALLAFSATCVASDELTNGKIEYQASCSNCHGMTAKGDGKVAMNFSPLPSDLTTLSARNGGKFPVQRVLNVIDGRSAKNNDPHGPRDMPVWGAVYLTDDGQPYELNVRNRIQSLIAYLQELQVK